MALVKRTNDDLWENISMLPRELKDIVGSYSRAVRYQKIFLRHQFFRRWSIENIERIIGIVRKWTKNQITWFLEKCKLLELFHFVMKKEELIGALHKKLSTSCNPGTDGVSSWCPTHGRKVWQHLKVIEIVHNVFEQRKRLKLKQRKALRKASVKL